MLKKFINPNGRKALPEIFGVIRVRQNNIKAVAFVKYSNHTEFFL